MRNSSLKDIAVASALVLGFLFSQDTEVSSGSDCLFFYGGLVLLILWIYLKLIELFLGD